VAVRVPSLRGGSACACYEWPADEHAIHIDYKGNVWFSSAGGPRLPTKCSSPTATSGEFVFLHRVAVDSKGSVYASEVGNGKRVQKFLRRR
jgi:hypothetical protein